MRHIRAYLETNDDGLCMAHMPELPGCTARAAAREQVLERLPDAIRDYAAWLRRHGEPLADEADPVEMEVLGESEHIGPFHPGNATNLLPPDLEPIGSAEVEGLLRRMEYARADLLALVSALPDEILDWQPDPERWHLRRVLRHIGNADKWYVSRIVPVASLPPDWERDAEMPLLEYLEMTRRTAVARLRELRGEDAETVFYPAEWTDHPEEGWTLRKALRRFLEHEREHTGQVREILSAWRLHLLARIHAERANLLAALVGTDADSLSTRPACADWTAKDLLAHVAAWDAAHLERMQQVLTGNAGQLKTFDTDARNAAMHAERKDWSLARTLQELLASRSAYLQALAQVSDEELHGTHQTPWGAVPVRFWAERRAAHDAAHAADLASFRKAGGLGRATGPRALLLAQLAAVREELLAAAALVPPDQRTARTVCGEWTLKDAVAHVADWERVAAEALRAMAAGAAPAIRETDIESFNPAHYSQRQNEA